MMVIGMHTFHSKSEQAPHSKHLRRPSPPPHRFLDCKKRTKLGARTLNYDPLKKPSSKGRLGCIFY